MTASCARSRTACSVLAPGGSTFLLVHDLDVWTHRSEDARRAQVEEFMAGGYRAMVELREQGAVRAIGAGINETAACQDLAERGDFDCFCWPAATPCSSRRRSMSSCRCASGATSR